MPSNAFYKTAAWLRMREATLARDNYLCQECLKNQRLTPADTVHHIEALEDAPEKALDIDNLLSVCFDCHNRLHPEKGFGLSLEKRIIAVLGYPAAGKTTWVESMLGEHDLVLDLDRLVAAMSYQDGHCRWANGLYAARLANDMIKDVLRNVRSKGYQFDTLYVIRTRLSDEEYDNLRAARAKLYWIGTDRKTCEARLLGQGRKDTLMALGECDRFLETYGTKLTVIPPYPKS